MPAYTSVGEYTSRYLFHRQEKGGKEGTPHLPTAIQQVCGKASMWNPGHFQTSSYIPKHLYWLRAASGVREQQSQDILLYLGGTVMTIAIPRGIMRLTRNPWDLANRSKDIKMIDHQTREKDALGFISTPTLLFLISGLDSPLARHCRDCRIM